MPKNEYLEEVVSKLSNNPTAQDLDFFIEAHARVGYLVSIAQAASESAEAQRKFDLASAYADAKRNGAKTSADAEASATLATRDSVLAEISARERLTKLRNLLNSIEQAINGIKFLGRATDVNLPIPRR
jgi:hypothetical protein